MTRFMCRKYIVLLLIYVAVVRASAAASNYDISHVFGNEFNFYFRNFDIVFGDWKGESGGSEFMDRETAHYSLDANNSQANLQPANSNETPKDVPAKESSRKTFWDRIKDEETIQNKTAAIMINLVKLDSLESILKDIHDILLEKSERHETNLKPYFIITWQIPLTSEQEKAILAKTGLAKGLDIDTDVYFTFLKCMDGKTSKNSSPPTNSTTRFHRFISQISVNATTCVSELAEIRILEFYSIKDQSFIQSVDLDQGLSLMQKVIRRTNLRSAPLSTVAAHGYPFRAKFSVTNDSFESGYEADQIKFLGDSFNLSIVVGVGKGWITMANNSLTGMGHQVTSGEADISISASEVLPYRAKALQFLHPTYYTNLWGFFVQPPSSSFRDIFINAFTMDLWLTMLSTWILIVLAMFSLSIVKRRLDTMHENDTVLIQELIIWAAGAVCQQGWHVCPESTCMKIIFIFALITGLVSYVAYSAALVSILSVKVVPIKNLYDIVNRGYTIYQDNQTINAMYVIQKLESEGSIPCLSREERSIRSEVALPKVLQEQSAFIGASDFFYPVAKKEMNDTAICNSIARVAISGRPVRGGMFIRKGSPFKDFFNHRLLIMYERGIRYRLLETYFRQSAVMCLEKTGNTKDALGFNDVYSAFVILVLGYCLSIFILVVERIFPPSQFHFVGTEHHNTEATTDHNSFLCSKTVMDNIRLITGLGLNGGEDGKSSKEIQQREKIAYDGYKY